jgi:hypothetical protein
MADYSIYVSFLVPLAANQLDWAIEELYRDPKDDDYELDNDPGVICEKRYAPSGPRDNVTDLGVERPVPPTAWLWIRNDESVDIDALCARLQTIMRRFDVNGRWGFSWSQDCSAPRVDAYCGGACIISQTQIEEISTRDWLVARGIRA